MTQSQMLAKLKILTGNIDDELLLTYLDLAGNTVLRRCYPFDKTKTTVPEQYQHNQIEIACYLFNKRGAEGQTAHNENGISRNYENGGVPHSMLQEIIPFVGIV